jgi:TorA maturation chaperone TorD
LLSGAPDAQLLRQLSGLEGDAGEFGQAVQALASAAVNCDSGSLKQEYFDLFIGIGQGELTPYLSYYLTGFLNEKPLARLRDDMARLGIARASDVTEPEDHISSLCEMMAGLINGDFGAPADLAAQRAFFDQYIGCWTPRFFEDLEAAEAASFYVPVGTIGKLFMRIELQAFEMAA